MFVISVIPLSKATTVQQLSYYASSPHAAGTVIAVPIRNKQIPALVIDTQPVSNAKTALRAATFSLKKLPNQEPLSTLPESIITTAETLLKTVPAELGSILSALLPPDVRTGQRSYPLAKTYTNEEDSTPQILTATRENRILAYRSLIRQAFAHRGSVLFVVPTSASVARIASDLQTGIEKRIVTFSSTHTKKQIDNAYEQFTDFTNAKLIITTPNFAFLDRHDITTIIIDESGSTHYKQRTRPYLDARDALITYAKVTKRSIILADTLPRTEEEAWRREDVYQTLEEHPMRHNFTSTFSVATHVPTVEKVLPIFTPELSDAITRTNSNRGRTLLLSARRGLAPLVLCGDCSYVFRCPDSGAPYSLFSTNKNGVEERWFYASASGSRVRAADTCPQCGSWRLREQGIGIQQVVQQARKLFPHVPITLFDHTTATTHKKAEKLISQFYGEKGSILIATNMVFPYLTQGIELTSIISYEALRAVPTWRAEENALSTILTLRENTENECIIQTRSETDLLLKAATRGLIDDFYDEEITMRKLLMYPPYATFILLSWTGTRAATAELENLITTTLATFDPQCYNTPLPSEKVTRHALIRVPYDQWPNEALMKKLRSLPPSIRIEVGPDRIV